MAETTLPALLSTGDHASRPAAADIGSGGLYSCTDHDLVYQTDGSSWTTWATLGAALPTLLKSRVVRTAGDISTTSTSFVDATSLSITGSTGARRCLVGFTGFVYHGSNQAGIYIQLDIDGTDQGGAFGMTGEVTVSGGNDAHNASFVYMTDVLTAASHTFKIRWRVTSGTGNMYAGTDVPATFWVAELA